jgi:hypothetical protein
LGPGLALAGGGELAEEAGLCALIPGCGVVATLAVVAAVGVAAYQVYESRRFPKGVKDETEARVREANGGDERCSTCGIELTQEPGHANSREFDHLTSVKNGGGNGSDNCDEKCRTHNRKKGSLNEDEWQKKVKEQPDLKKPPIHNVP